MRTGPTYTESRSLFRLEYERYMKVLTGFRGGEVSDANFNEAAKRYRAAQAAMGDAYDAEVGEKKMTTQTNQRSRDFSGVYRWRATYEGSHEDGYIGLLGVKDECHWRPILPAFEAKFKTPQDAEYAALQALLKHLNATP